MQFVNKLLAFFKEGAMSGTKVSSKRIAIYTMICCVVFMIAIEALFNLLLMYKWFSSECKEQITFKMVFDAIIYGYVFGLIAALSGINGWESKSKSPVDPQSSEQS